MSILNSVMNVFKLTGDDDYDEYHDYDEEFEDDEDDKGSARKKLFSGSHKNKDDEDYDSDSRTNEKAFRQKSCSAKNRWFKRS